MQKNQSYDQVISKRFLVNATHFAPGDGSVTQFSVIVYCGTSFHTDMSRRDECTFIPYTPQQVFAKTIMKKIY